MIEALILGVVQGATEWLPISSEGVLTLIQIHLLQRPLAESVAFAIWLHLGTLLAAVAYFQREISKLLSALPRWITPRGRVRLPEEDKRLLDFLGIATLVTGLVGAPLLALSLSLDVLSRWGTVIIGLLLIGTGLIQLIAPRFGLGTRTLRQLMARDAAWVGLAQGLAALPGLSRSGLTISTLLLRGLRETDALRLSFLMSIPVIFAAQFLLKLLEMLRSAEGESLLSVGVLAGGIGLLSAALVGWLTISALMTLAHRLPFWAFAIALGTLGLLAALL
jgi:undecaprenyl-diphosphatase